MCPFKPERQRRFTATYLDPSAKILHYKAMLHSGVVQNSSGSKQQLCGTCDRAPTTQGRSSIVSDKPKHFLD